VREAAITPRGESTMIVVEEGEKMPPSGGTSAREAAVSNVSEGFGPMLGMTLASGAGCATSNRSRYR
jgi:hypothetical protein